MKKKIVIMIVSLICVISILGGGFCFLFKTGLSGLRQNSTPKEGQIKVACVGDSITYGHGVENWEKNNYPKVLQNLLGGEYCVHNYGASGYCVQDDSNKPYKDLSIYQDSINFGADIVVFMMGSNDTKPYNWKNEIEFKQDLLIILDSYKNSEIILCTPATAFFINDKQKDETSFDIQPKIVTRISTITKEVALELNLELIDIHDFTANHPEWFKEDGVHPNKDGAKAIAQEIYERIVN